MKRNETKKGPKGYLPRQLNHLIFDIRAYEFGVEFLKFVGFLDNLEKNLKRLRHPRQLTNVLFP